MLSFETLRKANRARLPQFKNAKGELAHALSDGSDWSPAQWLQAVIGALGEYANIRKKFERGDITLEEFIPLAKKELADVVTYLDILAMRCLDGPADNHPAWLAEKPWQVRGGIDLGDAVRAKFNEVSERVGSTIRILYNQAIEKTPAGNKSVPEPSKFGTITIGEPPIVNLTLGGHGVEFKARVDWVAPLWTADSKPILKPAAPKLTRAEKRAKQRVQERANAIGNIKEHKGISRAFKIHHVQVGDLVYLVNRKGITRYTHKWKVVHVQTHPGTNFYLSCGITGYLTNQPRDKVRLIVDEGKANTQACLDLIDEIVRRNVVIHDAIKIDPARLSAAFNAFLSKYLHGR